MLYLFDPNSRSDQIAHMVSTARIDPQTGVGNRSKVPRYLGTFARAGILVVGLISRWIPTMFEERKNYSLAPSKSDSAITGSPYQRIHVENMSQHKNGAC